MCQGINGTINVEDGIIRFKLIPPLILRMLANKIRSRVRTEAALLLGKPRT